MSGGAILSVSVNMCPLIQTWHVLKSVKMLQIHRVQQRVTAKKALALKYGEELARAKALASKEIGKRKLEYDRFGVSSHKLRVAEAKNLRAVDLILTFSDHRLGSIK